MEFRKDIQILRGLAVLFVVLYHLQFPFLKNGYLGVDIFFVISGFLMARLYDKGTVMDFYRRRINRLAPAYFVTILVTILVGVLFLLPSEFAQLSSQSLYSLFFAGNIYFWNQNSYFSTAEFNPLLNLWSLGVEVQFYLFVPIFYPILRRYPWLLWVAILLSFAACLVMLSISPKTSFFMLPFRCWEFLLGALVAWRFDALKLSSRHILKYVPILSILALMAFAPLTENSKSWIEGHPGIISFAICALTAMMLACRLPLKIENNVVGTVLSKLGDYSYSIYLVHFPLIVLLNYKPFSGTKLQIEDTAHFVLAIFLITGLSIFLYQIIEVRSRRFLNNLKRHAVVLILILGVTLVSTPLNVVRFNETEQHIF